MIPQRPINPIRDEILSELFTIRKRNPEWIAAIDEAIAPFKTSLFQLAWDDPELLRKILVDINRLTLDTKETPCPH